MKREYGSASYNPSPSDKRYSYENGIVDKRYLATSTGTTTTTAMVNGMYVMCTNRSILDQGHIVTGTYFPPLATSQDHQNLGTTLTTSHISHLSTNSNNSNNNNTNKSSSNGIITSNHNTMQSSSVISTSSAMSAEQINNYYGTSTTAPLPAYPYTYKDYGLTYTTNEEVDSRELEKYLKYPDNNHNFNDYDTYHHNSPIYAHHQQQSADYYNYHQGNQALLAAQANQPLTSSAPTSTTKVDAMIGAAQLPTAPVALYAIPQQPNSMTDVYAANEQIKEDDFSNILAGVRKTCYSN